MSRTTLLACRSSRSTAGRGAWRKFHLSSDGNKAYGLAVDFSAANPLVYWTTPTDIESATDAGAAAVGTSILSAGANYAFRGLELVPTSVPEPSVVTLAGLGLAVLLRFRRKRI